MKSLLSFILLACLSSCNFAEPKHPSSIEVIFLKAKMITFFTDGNKDDFGQEMRIAFFKNYVLFEKPVQHHKAQTSFIDLNKTKDGDTIIDDSEPDMSIEKVTYLYYVYEQGGKRGLFYNEEKGKTKTFSVDTLFKESNLGKENEEDISVALGKPNETRKNGDRWSEKYYNLKKEIGKDTVFRLYNDSLKDFPFSISKKLDQEKNSKLIRSLQLVKIPPSLKNKSPFKVEFLTQMKLFTEKCSKGQLEKYKAYFNRYERDIKKTPITN